MATVQTLIDARTADVTAKAAADQAILDDQAKLAADQHQSAALATDITAKEAALVAALEASGPVVTADGTLYESFPAGTLRVVTTTPAASANLPTPPPVTPEPTPAPQS